ncbi:S41 family peptidase [Henriciella litoralis]|uniref:S41 family peptidase n=1 Tax=Henriciella litoralis TaxID=568102 RepID=UPI0009FC994C|nr:S41 family peptidase [Henriciella litoralis]
MTAPQTRPLVKTLLASAALGLVSACGGGGGGGGSPAVPPPPPPPPGTGGPTYTPGVYPAASQFKDQCANPRSGVDIEGNPFPDDRGTLVEELFWLRSWTNETYLWPGEVPDLNPYNYDNRETYFGLLKTDETTASGEDKDDFHFSQPTEDYLEQRNSAATPGYGANLIAYSTTVPRDFRVSYVEPNSPAAAIVNGQQKLIRGSRILEIDGVDLINASGQSAVDTLNDGLYPDTAGESHTFKVRDPDGTERTVTLSAENIVRQPVNQTNILDTASGKVGYIHFTTFSPFSSEKQIADAMRDMQNAGVSDLVLDLRYNGGGLLAVASQLSYMVAGTSRTNGRTFEKLRFNDKAGNINPVTGSPNNPIPFYRTGQGFSLANGASLPALNLDRVYILSTERTCSASEAVINGLRGVNVEVVLIGDTTCGKPFGFYPTDNCGETYYTIQFQGVNDKGFGDYADGFVPQNSSFQFGVRAPGCTVTDELSAPLGSTSDPLLAAALQYRADGSCPTPPSASASADSDPSSAPQSAPASVGPAVKAPPRDIFENNRDLSMPGEYRGRTK